jgi:hypothetical protein
LHNGIKAPRSRGSALVGWLVDLGIEILPPERRTPEALRALQKSDAEKWWPIVKAANIRAE